LQGAVSINKQKAVLKHLQKISQGKSTSSASSKQKLEKNPTIVALNNSKLQGNNSQAQFFNTNQGHVSGSADISQMSYM
jgi:hypothetical protein